MNNWKKLSFTFFIALIVFKALNYLIIPYPPINSNSQFKIFVFHLISGGSPLIICFAVIYLIVYIINYFSKEIKNSLTIAKTSFNVSIILNIIFALFLIYGRYKHL